MTNRLRNYEQGKERPSDPVDLDVGDDEDDSPGNAEKRSKKFLARLERQARIAEHPGHDIYALYKASDLSSIPIFVPHGRPEASVRSSADDWDD